MNVNRCAKMFGNHCRTFNMPAGSSPAPLAVPARQFRRRGFPQHEIAGIFLVRRNFHPCAGQHIFKAAIGQAAIIGILADIKQHMTFCRIGMAACDQRLHHCQHSVNMVGSTRLNIRRQNPQSAHIDHILRVIALGNDADINLFLRGAGVNFIINIGDIAGIGDFREKPSQQAHQHIKHHGWTRIANMRRAIDGRAAHINGHMSRVSRHKILFFAGQIIMQA